MNAIDELRRTMARLRAPDGCPWDREQTHASLVRCLIDEVSELIDTTEMYLRTVWELEEEGITPLRARIAEHEPMTAERYAARIDAFLSGL